MKRIPPYTEVIAPLYRIGSEGSQRIIGRHGKLFVVAARATIEHWTGRVDVSPHLQEVSDDEVMDFRGVIDGAMIAPNVRGYDIKTAVNGRTATIRVDRDPAAATIRTGHNQAASASVPSPDFAVRAAAGLATGIGQHVEFEASASATTGPRLVVSSERADLCINIPQHNMAAWVAVPTDELVTAGVHAAISAARMRPEGTFTEATAYQPFVPVPV